MGSSGSGDKKTKLTSSAMVLIDRMPKYGDTGEHVRQLQIALRARGLGLTIDGEFGHQTRAQVAKFQRSFGSTGTGVLGPITLEKLRLELRPEARAPINPAYLEAKKYAGKKETDSTFNKYLSGFWAKVGLSSYKTIVGTTFAWCGLFIFAMNTEVGQKAISGAAGAKNWAKYGVEVNWKRDGIPQGAVIHINNAGNCTSAASNHVTFADGSCTPEYLSTKGAVVPGYGGNQSDQVKRSDYSVSKVCQVRWPSEIELPARITKNISCGSGSDAGESTR